jgi:hypothetical protein
MLYFMGFILILGLPLRETGFYLSPQVEGVYLSLKVGNHSMITP